MWTGGQVLRPDEQLVLKVETNSTRRAVVQRDDDVLSPQQVNEHWPEIEGAMLKELQTWAKLQCFSRKPKTEARNVIDTRWVYKFKYEEQTVDATKAGFQNSSATAKRTIRARLTVRGFKDADKWDIDRYAGTSTRGSQKLIVSEAVLRGWVLCAADISKAFLQGVTYEELAKLTGEPAREVNFYLPAYNMSQLRQIPGFETFDPRTEVLHCDKPGTGLVDAPRAFSLKLQMVTRDKCGLQPSTVDQELCYYHDNHGDLKLIMTKHVDDLKFAGDPAVIQTVMTEIQKVFGELKVNKYEFTNCGVRHVQCPKTLAVTLDQIHFANTLKPIAHPQVSSGADDDEVGTELHALYRSLLGALAYLAHTRVDILVFICALQRNVAKPRVEHARKLNRVLRWVQRNPKKLHFAPFDRTSVPHLRVVSDAAFKKEPEDGYSLRGALFLRCETGGEAKSQDAGQAGGGDADRLNPTSQLASFTRTAPAHVIEWACRSQRHVTRSTFAAELLSAGDAVDQGILVSQMLCEVETGPMTAESARARRENGGFVPMSLYVDAKSVFAAVTASTVKIPADKSLFVHVQYLRELLDHRVLSSLVWLDTRDMTADGLTKGAVSRDLLHALMSGRMLVQHESEVWSAKRPVDHLGDGTANQSSLWVACRADADRLKSTGQSDHFILSRHQSCPCFRPAVDGIHHVCIIPPLAVSRTLVPGDCSQTLPRAARVSRSPVASYFFAMSAGSGWHSGWTDGNSGQQSGSAWTGGGDADRLNPTGQPNSIPDASSSTQQWSSSSSHWTSGREAQQQTHTSSGSQQWSWPQHQAVRGLLVGRL